MYVLFSFWVSGVSVCLSDSNLEINLPERVCYVQKNVLNDDVKISTESI